MKYVVSNNSISSAHVANAVETCSSAHVANAVETF